MPIINIAESKAEAEAMVADTSKPAHLRAHNARYNSIYDCWVYDTWVGFCISDREANHYDDSDFYMTVWNPDTGRPEDRCFASTRGWSYPCYGSSPDATPDVRAAYDAYVAKERAEYRAGARKAKARDLCAMRAKMYRVAKEGGFSYLRLLKLRNTDSKQFGAALYLLTAKVRSGFKLSLRNQLVNWLQNPTPAYPLPFSRKQLDYIPQHKMAA